MRTNLRSAVVAGLSGLALIGGTWLLAQPAPTPPATGPSVNASTRPATQIAMKFENAPIDTVLNYVAETTGYTILKETPGAIEGRISINSPKPVTPAEAVTLLNAVLRTQGFAAIQQDRLLKIVTRDKAKKLTDVFFGSDPALIPDTDELITQVIPLRSVEATRLRQDLASMIPIDADVAANAGSNAIIITDVSSNIKRVVKIVHELDKDAGTSDLKTFKLTNASASQVATLLLSIFKTTATSSSSSRGSSGGFGPPGFSFGGGDPRSDRDRGGGGGSSGSGAVDRALKEGRINAVADDRTNTLIVSGPPDTLKLMEGIIEKLDKSTDISLGLETFNLTYADSTSAAKLINSVFAVGQSTSGSSSSRSSDGSSDRSDRGSPRPDPSAAASAGISGVDAALRGGKVNAVADERTNSIIVTAPPEALPLIKKMVSDLDKNPISEQSFFIYPLRNGQALQLEYVLNVLFGNSTSGGTANRTSASSRTGANSRTGGSGTSGIGGSGGIGGTGSTSRAGGTGSGSSRGTTSFGGTSGFGGTNGQFGGAGGQLSGQNQRVASDLTGQVLVVADEDTNSLLVTVATRYADPVKQIIAELDRPRPQVLIKVLVAEVTHDDSVDFGVDFSIINRRANGQGITVGSAFGNATATTGLVVSLLEDKLNMTLHALATNGKLDVLSRPYILASDNQLASITVGNEVPFITNTRITDTGQTINTIQYQDVGIILNVLPHINPDGLVIMDVVPEISQLTGTTVPISDNVSAPVIAKRSAESRVGVRTGQTIVIGGLMEDRKTSTINKIPLLGDIPVIGPAVFSRTQVTKSKTELLIFLTPHVAQQPDLLESATEQEKKTLKLTPKSVAPGKFDEHLDGMRTGEMPSSQPANAKEPSKNIPIPPRVPSQSPSNPGMQQQVPQVPSFQPGSYGPPAPTAPGGQAAAG
ncbi:secretin N-terminal domain-containing protein [Humisphaera borealis]|uniref:Type II secretion system protein GspD n=1 Tax=Humisphaera borealis TaxID=2807512 RepID=A0A7M2WWF3_9BACT|nr:secretin N-terminal domain-containing protein [Humisphaera borealis]QOV89825.1 hypothetical protein IPV69_00170 [Humisphaera borealis]